MTYRINPEKRKNIKVLKTSNNSNALLQTSSTSEIVWNGSTIAYTPSDDADYIIYEFIGQSSRRDFFNNMTIRLVSGSNDSSFSSIESSDYGYKSYFGQNNTAGNGAYSELINVRFAIPKSYWSGQKYLALKCTSSSNQRTYINSYSYNPTVIIYSIWGTNNELFFRYKRR